MMKSLSCLSTPALTAALMSALLGAGPALAQHAAHVHGQVQVEVAVDGPLLSVRLQAPLDSLVGFEHRPRTPAQRQAADAALARVDDVAAWLRPAAAANCTLATRSVEAAVLRPAPDGAVAQDDRKGHDHKGHDHKGHDHDDHDGHADLVAQLDFRCAAPPALDAVELMLFNAFSRIKRIDVQVAGPQGQRRQTLRPPATQVALTR